VSAQRSSSEQVQPDHRTTTRRRGAQLTAAIYQAVFAELRDSGYASLTMEAVARRARTGKASLYRRWPTRTELVMDAVYDSLPSDQSVPNTGTLRGDIIGMLTAVVDQLAGPTGEALRGLRGEALVDPAGRRRVRDYSRDAALGNLREIVARAIRRGEVNPADVTAYRLEAGPAIVRDHILFHDTDDVDIEALVDDVIIPLLTTPLRARSGSTAPTDSLLRRDTEGVERVLDDRESVQPRHTSD